MTAEELKQKVKVLNVRRSEFRYSFTEEELEEYTEQVEDEAWNSAKDYYRPAKK